MSTFVLNSKSLIMMLAGSLILVGMLLAVPEGYTGLLFIALLSLTIMSTIMVFPSIQNKIKHKLFRPEKMVDEFLDEMVKAHATSIIDHEKAETLAQKVIDTTESIIVVIDHTGCVEAFNKHATKVTGYQPYEIIGKPLWHSLIPLENIEDVKSRYGHISAETYPEELISNWVAKSRETVTIRWHNAPIMNLDNRVTHVVCTGTDITKKLANEKALALAEASFETHDALVITDPHGIILKTNTSFQKITGYNKHEVIGMPMSILKSGRHDRDFYDNIWQTIYENGEWQGEIWNRRKTGEIYPEWLKIKAVKNDQKEVVSYIGNFIDITDKKQAEKRLEEYAFTDPLTALPNRRAFKEYFTEFAVRYQDKPNHFALILIDIDDLKRVNDMHGHLVGDRYLKKIAQRLKALISPEMRLGRYSGDEFLILIPCEEIEDLHQQRISTRQLAERIQLGMQTPIQVNNLELFASLSLGITLNHEAYPLFNSMLSRAGAAMHLAKNDGKNTYHFYSEELQKELQHRYRIEQFLKEDIKKQSGFFMVYQPQFNVNKEVIGAEALLRWNSPSLGFVSPAEFIPIAEEMGLMDQLGEIILLSVIKDIENYGRKNLPESLSRISINLSIKQLYQKDLAERLQNHIQKADIPANFIRLEFTESAFLDTRINPESILLELSQQGFSFALDDFGTGFSSMSYLKQLPISEIKIDKMFVDDLPINEDDQAICETTLILAQRLGLETVSEGIETEAQFNWLKEKGCDLFQGYYLAKPAPLNDLFTTSLEQAKSA